MKTAVIVAASIINLISFAYSQTASNDYGARDTLSLVISTPPVEGLNVPVVLEIWVYNDEEIVSFSSGFRWTNTNIRLDSARQSSFLRSHDIGIFLYYNDDYNSSNLFQKFQMGGYSIANPVAPNPQGRRKWVTYYFTAAEWQSGDSLAVTMLPESDVEFAFITNGPVYPMEFEPSFGGPLLFPGVATSITDEPTIPASFELYQNFPNPFNPGTTIEFELFQKSRVTLEILNVLGQRMTTLIDATSSAGRHTLVWDGKTDNGREAPSGVYFYRLRTFEQSITRKMTLTR